MSDVSRLLEEVYGWPAGDGPAAAAPPVSAPEARGEEAGEPKAGPPADAVAQDEAVDDGLDAGDQLGALGTSPVAPSWASVEALEAAFEDWVPGPPAAAPQAERSFLEAFEEVAPAPPATAAAAHTEADDDTEAHADGDDAIADGVHAHEDIRPADPLGDLLAGTLEPTLVDMLASSMAPPAEAPAAAPAVGTAPVEAADPLEPAVASFEDDTSEATEAIAADPSGIRRGFARAALESEPVPAMAAAVVGWRPEDDDILPVGGRRGLRLTLRRR